VVDVPMSHIAKASMLTSKPSGRKTNPVRTKKKRRKIDSTDDETSDAEYA